MQTGVSGIIPILLTPFKSTGEIDFSDLRSLVRYYMDNGSDGLACLGEVSETSTLSEEECSAIVNTVIDAVKGEIPVVVGIGRNTIESTAKAAADAEKSGAAALLLSPPRDRSAKEETVIAQYEAVDRQTELPIIILDNPSLGFPHLSVDTIGKIFQRTKRVRSIKMEDQPTVPKIVEIKSAIGPDTAVFGASHGRNLYWEMERGITGVMTSVPLPDQLREIWENYHAGRKDLSRRQFYVTVPLTYFSPETTISTKKEILKYLGIIKNSSVRSPTWKIDPASIQDLHQLVDWTKSAFPS